MKDTPQAVQELYRTLLMEQSGVERLKMGCAMFDASRILARVSLQAQLRPDEDMRAHLFIRTYEGDFEPSMVERIAKTFTVRHGQQP